MSSLLLGCGAKIPPTPSDKPKDPPQESTNTGKDYYEQQCLACHGKNGQGNPALKGSPLKNCTSCISKNVLTHYIRTQMPPKAAGQCDTKMCRYSQ